MRHTTVINNVPWVNAIAIGLLAASFFTKGPLSLGLTLAALMVLGAVMGALLTHFPPLPGSGQRE